MKKRDIRYLFTNILAACVLITLISCGVGDSPPPTDGGTTPTDGGSTSTGTAKASSLKLSAKPVSVKSDDSDETTVAATVLDANNAAVKNLIVIFSADGGKLSDSSAITDEKGVAKIIFSSGTLEQSNRVVTITGKASGLSSQVPVSITGSTLTMDTDKTAITDDNGVTIKAKLTITAKDAGGNPVFDTPIKLSVNGSGGVNLSAASGNTDVYGIFSVTVTGTSAGSVTVTATGLGATATQIYTVSTVTGSFGITSPADDPYPLPTNTPLEITVNAPGITSVQFATTQGVWDGGGSAITTKAVIAGKATASFSSSQAGLATIQVSDPNDTVKSDTTGIAVYAPFSAAAAITLQPSASVIAPSTTTIKHTITLKATVRTSAATGSQVVGGAPVSFTILNPTGGGETISPVVAYTNGQGVATTTFSSGSLGSGQSQSAVIVQASVVGAFPLVAATTNIVIGGTAGSVMIGRGTVIEKLDPATYRLPMSVVVADSNGNPVAGAVVSLSAWPAKYNNGAWYDSDPDPDKDNFVPYISGTYSNEDLDEDMVEGPLEDVNADGFLTPQNSAAGTLPTTVTTDENGVANFYLVYVKASAVWIDDRIRASTLVLGTETTSELLFTLPPEKVEAKSGVLPDSPYAMWLAVSPGGTVSQNIAPFTPSAVYSTFSSYSSIAVTTTVTYNFTAPAGTPVGTIFNDSISMVDFGIGVRVPVRIIVK